MEGGVSWRYRVADSHKERTNCHEWSDRVVELFASGWNLIDCRRSIDVGTQLRSVVERSGLRRAQAVEIDNRCGLHRGSQRPIWTMRLRRRVVPWPRPSIRERRVHVSPRHRPGRGDRRGPLPQHARPRGCGRGHHVRSVSPRRSLRCREATSPQAGEQVRESRSACPDHSTCRASRRATSDRRASWPSSGAGPPGLSEDLDDPSRLKAVWTASWLRWEKRRPLGPVLSRFRIGPTGSISSGSGWSTTNNASWTSSAPTSGLAARTLLAMSADRAIARVRPVVALQLLLDLKRRGLDVAPELAVGDLGRSDFWKALPTETPRQTREQRCMAATRPATF